MTAPLEDDFGFDMPDDLAQSPAVEDTPVDETAGAVDSTGDLDFGFDVPDFGAPDSARGEVVPPPSPDAAQGPLPASQEPVFNTVNALKKIGSAPLNFVADLWQDAVSTVQSAGVSVIAYQDAYHSWVHGDDPAEIDRRFNRWKYIALTAQGLADMSPIGLQAKLMGVPLSKKDPDFLPNASDLPGELQDQYTWDEAYKTSKMPLAQALEFGGPNIPVDSWDALKHAGAGFAEEYKRDLGTVTLGEAATYLEAKKNQDWFNVVDKVKDPLAAAVQIRRPDINEEDLTREMRYGVLNPVIVGGTASSTFMDVQGSDPIPVAGEAAAVTGVFKPVTKLMGNIDRAFKGISAGRKFSAEEAGLALDLLEYEEVVRNQPNLTKGQLPRGINSPFELVALKEFRGRVQAIAERSGLTYDQFKASLETRGGRFRKMGPAAQTPPPPKGGPPPPVENPIITPPPATPSEPIITPPPLQKTPAEMEEPKESGIGAIISRGQDLARKAEDREVDIIRESIQKTGEPPARDFSVRAKARAGILGRRDFAEHLGTLRKGLREAGSDFQKISGIGSSARELADLLEGTGYENWSKELASFEKEVLQAFEDSWMRAAAEAELDMESPMPVTDTGRGVQELEARGPEVEEPKLEEPTPKAEEPKPGVTQPDVAEAKPKNKGGRPVTRKQDRKQKVKQAIKEGTAGKKALTQPEVQEISKRMAFMRNQLNAMPPGFDRDHAEVSLNIMNQALENRGKVPASLRRALDEILNKPRMGPGAASPEEFKKLNEEYRMYLAEKFHRAEQAIKAGEEPLYHHTDIPSLNGIAAEGGIKTPFWVTRRNLANVPASSRDAFTDLVRTNTYRDTPASLRIVTTREELQRQGFPLRKEGIKSAAEEFAHGSGEIPQGSRFFPGEVQGTPVPLKAILKIEIDPSALPGNHEAILSLIKNLEDQGIPVVIKPLFQQTNVHEFRPILPPVMEKSAYKAVMGADEATNISIGLAKVAKETETVEEAAMAMRNLKTGIDNRMGGALDDAGIKTEGKTPEQIGKELVDAQVPGLSDAGREYLPRFRVQRVITDPARLLMTPNPMASMGPDVTGLAAVIANPDFVLNNKTLPLSKGVFDLQRWGRYYADQNMKEYADAVVDVAEIFRANKKSPKLSERLFDAVNVDNLKGFSAGEIESIKKAQAYINAFVRKNEHKFFEKLSNSSLDEFVSARREWNRKGLLEKAGFLAWEPEDMFASDFMKQLKAEAVPPELVGENLDNPILAHALPGLKGHKDIISSLRVLGPGIVRTEVWRPTWKDMALTAENLPPRMKNYVSEWIKAQKGVKSRLHQMVKGAETAGRFKIGDITITPAEELAGMILTGFYRGALYGNMGYYLANFLGQGVANTYAAHGPLAPFQGIARHFQRSFDGVNSEQLLGGFKTVLGREIPKTPFADEIMRVPAMKQMRGFLDWVEDTAGPTQSEFINRSIGAHVGLQQSIDKYNARNGSKITFNDVLDMEEGGLKDRFMYEALQTSDNVNFLYGMDGSNPFIRNSFGRTPVALVGQFMSFIPKQTEFFGKALKEGDPGVIIRYLTATGWMSNLAAKSLGIDLTNSFFFGSVASNIGRGSPISLGPVPQLLTLTWKIMGEEDAVKRDNLIGDFVKTASLVLHPGMLQRQKTEHFFRQLRAGRLLSQDGPPYDMLASWGPEALQQHGPIFGPNGRVDWTHTQIESEVARILISETPGRFMGMPMVSDRQERMIYKAASRIQSKWRLGAKKNVEALMVELQNGKTFGDPKVRQLIDNMRQDGIPVDGMIQTGVMESSVPKMMRWFMDQSNLYKGDFYDYIKALYPETFDKSPVMDYNYFGPKKPMENPADSLEYQDWIGDFPSIGEFEGVTP